MERAGTTSAEDAPVSFSLYVLGFVIVIAGVSWLLITLGVSTTYVFIAALILLGLGVATGAARTRAKDPPA
jgi:apolipoprotein N-acyltransferase